MLRAGFVLLFGSVMAAIAQTQSWATEAAAQLAARISSPLQRRTTVSLDLQSLATLAPAESSSFRSALQEELRKAGLEVAAQPELRLKVTVSENQRGLLFVAESLAGENKQVAFLPWPTPARTEAKPRTRIDAQPMFQQLEPVLDILLTDGSQTMLALSPTKISTYRLSNGKWGFAGVASIATSRPPGRDPRGRLEMNQNGFHAYLPGTSCTGAIQADVKLNCMPGDEPWPVNPRDPGLSVRWVSDRNLLESDGVRNRFFTAAGPLFSFVDGRVQDRTGENIPGTDAWGSDLAAIENSCGANQIVIAAKAGTSADHDEIQAYELANGAATASSAPVSLSGSVSALWPAETSGQATLVTRNSKTGNYEVSRLRVACAE